jgi:hypothetical protein
MPSPYLNITHVAASQNQKEVTINDAVDALDEAMNATKDVDCSAGGMIVIAAADYTGNYRLHLTGAPAAAFDLQVPDTRRAFVVDNATGKTATVKRTSAGGATVDVPTGKAYMLLNIGTDVILVGGGGGGLPAQDTTAVVQNAADNTKQVKISAASLSTGTTRTATMPDKDGTMAMTADIPVFAGARAYHNAAQSIASGGPGTVLALNSERYDTDGFHDTVTNSSRLTVPAGKDGKYRITGTVQFAANATGERRLEILLNGATVIGRVSSAAVSGTAPTVLTVTCDYGFVAGDYVELRAFQDSGGALDAEAVGNYSPEFAIANFGGAPATAVGRGALAKKTAAQSIVNATDTPLTFDAEVYDTDAIHDTVTNNSRLTVPAGVTTIRLVAGVEFAANATGVRRLWFRKNGADFDGGLAQTVPGNSGVSNWVTVVSPILNVAPGDFFEAFVNQNSGGALNANATVFTMFGMELLDRANPFRGALVKKTAAQSIANASNVGLSFDADVYDTDTIHDTVTNNSRLTVPAGVRLIRLVAGVEFAANATGVRVLWFRKNGSNFDAGFAQTVPGHATLQSWAIVVSPVLNVAAGDYFEAFVYQNSGAALNTNATAFTSFGMEIVG